jgi:phage/plasmid-like protein (TIGR03299 family)
MGDTIEAGFSGRGLSFYGMSNARTVDGVLSVSEALTAAGLDWRVNKIPAGYNGENGEFVPAGAKYHLTQRSDNGAILGAVGNQYTVFQNEQAFAFADELLGYGAEFHAAGAYNQGANVFLIAKLPEGIKVEGEEDMDLYLDMINTHDGSGAISWYATPIRRNCTNQTRLMISKAVSSAKIRHTATASERVAQVAETLRLVDTYKKSLEEGVKALQDFEMELEEVANFLNEWSESERVVKNVLETYNTSELVPRGNAWGVTNAITQTLLHNPARRTAGESRWASNLDGPNQRHIERASRMLLTRRNG